MPWLDAVNKCPACGTRHRLCHPTDGAPMALAIYQYRCPVTKEVVELPPDLKLKRVERYVPAGTVELAGPV